MARATLLLLSVLLCAVGAEQRSATSARPCQDKHPECPDWATKNQQCVSNSGYMRKECPRSCNVHNCAHRVVPLLWEGFATPYGTRSYAASHPGAMQATCGEHFRWAAIGAPLTVPGQRVRGEPWLYLSSLGIGSYLGDADEETDERVTTAVLDSVNAGWNVVDTAANYRGPGRAEAAIGEAMQDCARPRARPGSAAAVQLHALCPPAVPGAVLRGSVGIVSTIQRAMLFVSTKAGYVDAELLAAAGKAAAPPDVADGPHCIAPACLQASLERSLRLLRLATVDLLYLHNVAEAQLARLGADAFDAALRRAFVWLEEARQRGQIKAYGMATWDCFRLPPGAPGHLSLARVVALAEAAGGADHGFRYVQLPINAAMPEAHQNAWQHVGAGGREERMTLLEAAARLGVTVFASGPLAEGALLRNETLKARAEAAAELGGVAGAGPKLLHFVRSTPLVAATLVGHKQTAHVHSNLAVASVAPLAPDDFRSVARALSA